MTMAIQQRKFLQMLMFSWAGTVDIITSCKQAGGNVSLLKNSTVSPEDDIL